MTCPHFSDLIFVQAQKYAAKNALWYQDKTEKWIPISWIQFAQKVGFLSKAISDLGIKPQDKIAIYSNNRVECFVADFAAYSLNAITVPLYSTSSIEQIEFIINDAEISIILVGNQEQYENTYELQANSKYLKNIIIFDDTVITHGEKSSHFYRQLLGLGEKSTTPSISTNLNEEQKAKSIANILYTSGTTGEPKGVIITHENYLEAMRIHDIRLTSVTEKDKSLAFLPINHVFERAWCYFCLFKGVEIYINEFPQKIQQTIVEVKPTLMCTVPRFWEKVYIGVQATIDSYSSLMKLIVNWAIIKGKKHNIDYIRLKRVPPLHLKLAYYIANKLVFSKLKHRLGMERANLLPTAGASLSDDITVFFRSMGLPIVYGYGLTETTATVSCFDYFGYAIGTVGSLMPDVHVKIGENGELLIKGKTVTPGYYNRPEINKEVFTADGYFRTGDAGKLAHNNIVLTERLKDLYKTSNGKYIAPQQIELRLTSDKYFPQVAVIADKRNFVSAIIHPNIDLLKRFAKEHFIEYKNIDELIKNPEVIYFLEERISQCQKRMANYEKIKRFTLIKTGFSMETGELTNTLKLRRNTIAEKYKSQIDLMYQE